MAEESRPPKTREEKPKTREEKEKELRQIIVDMGNSRKSKEAIKAVAYCELCISEYEHYFEHNEARWFWCQRIVIIGGVIATLAGVMSVPESWIDAKSDWRTLGWLRGVPAAIVTIAAAFLSSFTYREDAVRHELTANALWNEMAKYQGHAEPYNRNERDDTSLFLNNICRLVDTELHHWSALVLSSRTEPNKGGDKRKRPRATPSAPA